MLTNCWYLISAVDYGNAQPPSAFSQRMSLHISIYLVFIVV